MSARAVVVLGAGVVGAACARELARRRGASAVIDPGAGRAAAPGRRRGSSRPRAPRSSRARCTPSRPAAADAVARDRPRAPGGGAAPHRRPAHRAWTRLVAWRARPRAADGPGDRRAADGTTEEGLPARGRGGPQPAGDAGAARPASPSRPGEAAAARRAAPDCRPRRDRDRRVGVARTWSELGIDAAVAPRRRPDDGVRARRPGRGPHGGVRRGRLAVPRGGRPGGGGTTLEDVGFDAQHRAGGPRPPGGVGAALDPRPRAPRRPVGRLPPVVAPTRSPTVGAAAPGRGRGRRATTATASCWRRRPASWWPTCCSAGPPRCPRRTTRPLRSVPDAGRRRRNAAARAPEGPAGGAGRDRAPRSPPAPR